MIIRKFFIMLLIFPGLACGAKITYEFSGGRFGDNLLAYIHAKWIQFIYGSEKQIDLLYKPFKYSDKLMLHVLEENKYEIAKKSKKKEIVLSKNNVSINPYESCLYIIPYFSEIAAEREMKWNQHWIYFAVDYDNIHFYRLLKEYIKPIDATLLEINIPKNCVTVAVHVRKGEGFDGPLLSEDVRKRDKVDYADINVPLRFPPDSFYIEQLKKISEMYNHQKIYAFIFTDVKSPISIVEKFKKELISYPNIELDCKKIAMKQVFAPGVIAYDSGVLEDFFAMIQFDCLIRPDSNFSIVAAKLAHYEYEIVPIKHHWEGHKSIIDEVEIKTARIFHD